VLLLARELWPRRRALHLVALVLTASSPALVRASAMYHPETLAVALAAGGLLVTVRALRTGWTAWSCVAAGVLLGLAALTRMWALPVLVAVFAAAGVDAYGRRRWRPVAVLVASALVLVAPWLAHQQATYGSALAFNRSPPEGSILTRRPAAFYTGLHLLHALEHPVTPLARNELVPHLYADWWGDWALSWDSPPPPPPAALLPPTVVAERARQSAVGLVPSLLALAGILALGLLANARRSAALAVLPLTAAAVLTAYLVFAVRYPSTDGDTIKGTYLLMVLPAGAVGAALVVESLRPRGRAGALLVAAALSAVVVAQLPFLVL